MPAATTPDTPNSPRITIHGSANPPDLTYTGRIIHVIATADHLGGGDFLADLCRFARVKAVTRRTSENAICAHCNSEAHTALDVIWESDYISPDHIICENCLTGLVTSGEELIDFPSSPDGETTKS